MATGKGGHGKKRKKVKYKKPKPPPLTIVQHRQRMTEAMSVTIPSGCDGGRRVSHVSEAE